MIYVGNKDICGVCRHGYHLRCQAVQEGVAITQREISFTAPVCKCDCWGLLQNDLHTRTLQGNMKAVSDYLSDGGSLREVAKRHDLSKTWLGQLVARRKAKRVMPESLVMCAECSVEFPEEELIAITDRHWCCQPCTERR